MTLIVRIFDHIRYYKRPACGVVFWTNHPVCALGGILLLKNCLKLSFISVAAMFLKSAET